MGAIAVIEATASWLVTAAFGIDYLKTNLRLVMDADSIAIADADSDRVPAREMESTSPAGDAAEWLPLCDGTGSALALSMLHVLWNELGVYDEEFLKYGTNAPYLVGDDGYYLRDEQTHRLLVFDASDRRIKTPDDPSLRDPSIKWTCEVKGRQGRPAFELLRERLARYVPEIMEPLTRIPAATVRSIALEFGDAASAFSLLPLDPMERTIAVA